MNMMAIEPSDYDVRVIEQYRSFNFDLGDRRFESLGAALAYGRRRTAETGIRHTVTREQFSPLGRKGQGLWVVQPTVIVVPF